MDLKGGFEKGLTKTQHTRSETTSQYQTFVFSSAMTNRPNMVLEKLEK